MQSTFGCKAQVKVLFPKEDIIERKKEQTALKGNELSIKGKQKSTVKLEIEYKIQRMLLNPQLYDEFLEEFAIKKKKAMLEKVGYSSSQLGDENIIQKNI